MNFISLIQSIINKLESSNVRLVQLRPKKLDDSIENNNLDDIDFLIDPQDLATIKKIVLEEVKLANSSLVILERTDKVNFFIWHNQKEIFFSIECWKEYLLLDTDKNQSYLRLADCKECLEDNQEKLKFLPDFELSLYINHLYTRGKPLQSEQVIERLHYYKQKISAAKNLYWTEDVRTWFLEQTELLLSEQITIEEYSQDCLSLLQKSGLANQKRALEDDLSIRLSNAVSRRITKLLTLDQKVAFIGPDGSGKSTLLATLCQTFPEQYVQENFKLYFRYNKIYNLLRKFLPEFKKEDLNFADDKYSFVMYWLAILQFFRENITREKTDQLICIDRYFNDLLFKNYRVANKKTRKGLLYNLRSKIFPLPESIVQPYAPIEVVYQRKQDESAEKLQDYEMQMEKVYCSRSPRRYILASTSCDINESIKFLEHALKASN